ncbi:MAG: YiiX/YebB-like N1pC/P60 family cysteine hydrolase [Candidatus Endonucleobacter bathymodioli]|uniref:YiiX/YebB-like N1pC/P60 family cysteine hydrolase n=1 Tax=Candidatus Endonucleibacter bathymodioli TaxID=539814 RepID=A0AA90NTN5_9GAMM|nr:YiiX/YebB-like N1pC/P60 family cysteine hydrolase [Candidatus Endonucleobacter bathymodioli]
MCFNEQTLSESLQPGDLLFQLCKGGPTEWFISRLFEGIKGQAINHVGIYIGEQKVVEAVAPMVAVVSLKNFIGKSVIDISGLPCITVSRLPGKYSALIPQAIKFAKSCVTQLYDDSYGIQRGWYCSKLIIEAFKDANDGRYLFKETPMSFKDPESGEGYAYWVNHYKQYGEFIHHGEPGSHPALLSLSDNLVLVKTLGILPYKNANGLLINSNCLLA